MKLIFNTSMSDKSTRACLSCSNKSHSILIPTAIVLIGFLQQANAWSLPPMPLISRSPENTSNSTTGNNTNPSTGPAVSSTPSTGFSFGKVVPAIPQYVPGMEMGMDAVGVVVEMSYLKFKYFNRNHPDVEFLINITDDNFAEDLRRIWNYDNTELKIITHGWISSDASLAVADIKDAYLEDSDLNVITLDWSYTASTKMYPIPAVMTHQVGTLAGDVLNKLVEEQFTTYDKIHMIGHSLGAHVSGSAGSRCKQKIARITGLDPAGPGFTFGLLGKDRRLDDGDAEFVDAIHTAAGMAGYYGALGHADFYPNSGKPPQPGCKDFFEERETSWFGCSHMRSYMLYSESVRNKTAFRSIRAQSWSEYVAGTYPNETDVQYMGDPLSHEARGIYYCATGDRSPYSIVDSVASVSRTVTNTAGR